MARRLCFIVEYCGTDFTGWQTQRGMEPDTSIQTLLHTTLKTVLRCELPQPVASGRTDSGVHAAGQVVHLDLPEECFLFPLQGEEFSRALAQLIKSVSCIHRQVLAIRWAGEVSPEFHAQHGALKKEYHYRICHRGTPPALGAPYLWHVPFQLDYARMEKELSFLVGRHDFTTFRAGDCGAKSPVRTVLSASMSVEHEYLTVRICAEGFLKQMIRNIVGTLIEQGRGRIELNNEKLLYLQNRRKAGPTAPASGLMLMRVWYPEEFGVPVF